MNSPSWVQPGEWITTPESKRIAPVYDELFRRFGESWSDGQAIAVQTLLQIHHSKLALLPVVLTPDEWTQLVTQGIIDPMTHYGTLWGYQLNPLWHIAEGQEITEFQALAMYAAVITNDQKTFHIVRGGSYSHDCSEFLYWRMQAGFDVFQTFKQHQYGDPGWRIGDGKKW